jgi:hypothetical protein
MLVCMYMYATGLAQLMGRRAHGDPALIFTWTYMLLAIAIVAGVDMVSPTIFGSGQLHLRQEWLYQHTHPGLLGYGCHFGTGSMEC